MIEGGCVLCGRPAAARRRREAAELAGSYATYYGVALPAALVTKYFREAAVEFSCRPCGVRYYTPDRLGEGDFYEALARMFDWYYAPSWDKGLALDHLTAADPGRVVEVGCGDGWFLNGLRERGISAVGIDINERAVAAARGRGLQAFLPHEADVGRCDVLCLFQTIEHMSEPVEFLAPYLDRLRPRSLLLSAPCYDSLLGSTSDPLVWPPHHRTAWSERGFKTLAGRLGLRVRRVWHQPLGFGRFLERQRQEPTGRVPSLPYLPGNRFGRAAFRIFGRLGMPWARCDHSIMVSIG